MTGNRPRVTLKLATSLDGRIALANGVSQWITSPASRAEVHQLRARHDVVLTGIGTVLADNPKMTVRDNGIVRPEQPMRAVLDTNARTPAEGQYVQAGPVTIFHSTDDIPRGLAESHAELVRIDRDLEGHVSIAQAIAWLGNVGHRSVMIEAGGKLAASAIKAGLVDKIEWFRAPVLLGGDGRPAIAALGLENLEAPPTFTRKEVRDCGPDIWESWERS